MKYIPLALNVILQLCYCVLAYCRWNSYYPWTLHAAWDYFDEYLYEWALPWFVLAAILAVMFRKTFGRMRWATVLSSGLGVLVFWWLYPYYHAM